MRFRPAIDIMPYFMVYRSNSQHKTPKNGKNKIRPANCKIDGVIMPSVRGLLRTLIPARGRKRRRLLVDSATGT